MQENFCDEKNQSLAIKAGNKLGLNKGLSSALPLTDMRTTLSSWYFFAHCHGGISLKIIHVKLV